MKTNTPIFRYIALLACIALICGCMSTRSGTDYNSANISKLKVGETTEKEVIELIGRPVNRTRNSDGSVMLNYMYNPGGTITGIPMVSFQNKGEAKNLMVFFDANGKLLRYTENGSQ